MRLAFCWNFNSNCKIKSNSKFEKKSIIIKQRIVLGHIVFIINYCTDFLKLFLRLCKSIEARTLSSILLDLNKTYYNVCNLDLIMKQLYFFRTSIKLFYCIFIFMEFFVSRSNKCSNDWSLLHYRIIPFKN